MLVCSVVLSQARTLGAAVAEHADAIDEFSIGAVFAILADVPGTSSDYLDAFVGKRMVEPASAADVVDASSIRNAAIVEEISAAIAVQNASIGAVGGVARAGMVGTVFVNSSGTARQANADGVMLNL